jgi:hypothetical protein
MKKRGQFLFLGGKPTPLTTHENDRIGFENVQQTLFLVPAKAYANLNLKVLATCHCEGLETIFRGFCGNRWSSYRKLSWDDLRKPQHDSRIQAPRPSAGSVRRDLSPKPGRIDDVYFKLRAESTVAGQSRGCGLLASCE